MTFFFMFTTKCVPQWKQCYYDYTNLKSLIILCKKAYSIRSNIEDLARQDNYDLEENQHLISYKDILQLIKVNKRGKIEAIITEANLLFYRYHSISKKVAFLFCQYKIHQLNARLTKYMQWQSLVVDTQFYLLELLSNCYAQNIKLLTMVHLHLQAYHKIHKSHQKAFQLFNMSTPGRRTARLARTLLDMNRYTKKLQQILNNHQQIVQRQTKYKLEQSVQPSPLKRSLMSYFFGLFNGFSICLVVASVIILALDLGKNLFHRQIFLDSRIIFENQYRLWKGTGFIIIYIWIFALSFYIYQTKGINYNLIFAYKSKTKKSSYNLGLATFFALLWSTFFMMYCMNLVGIYLVVAVREQPRVPISVFFPIVILCVLVLAVIVNLINARRGMFHFIIIIMKVLLTPFGFYEVIFGVIWGTEQFFSLVMVFYDVAYSFCYYTNIVKIPDTQDNHCFDFMVMVEIVSIILFIIQLLQSIRVGIEKKKFCWTRQYLRGIRALLYIILLSLSIASTKNNKKVLWFWIVFAVICSVYSFMIDVFFDWSLFVIGQNKTGKKVFIRRQQNILKIGTINLMVGCNFICRFSFVMMICPKIVFTYVTYPQLVMAIAQTFQMIRRLIWNILRVQNQQVQHNYHFKIRTNYQSNEKKIIHQLEENGIKYSKPEQIQQKRTAMEFETLREYIREKNKWKEMIVGFWKRNDRFLDQLEKQAQEEIEKVMGKIR